MTRILVLLIFFILVLSCSKEESKSDLLIGKWCLIEELSSTNTWIESDKLTITFTKKGDVSIIDNDSQTKCESTYSLDESTSMINSTQNCARYRLESVDQNQLILYHQGRSEVYKYKFKRC